MPSKPYIGDLVEHPFMGEDARIEISEVPDDQPLVETDGMHVIIDQYGEQHIIELDGDTWVTSSTDALSDDGFDRWQEYLDRAGQSASF